LAKFAYLDLKGHQRSKYAVFIQNNVLKKVYLCVIQMNGNFISNSNTQILNVGLFWVV